MWQKISSTNFIGYLFIEKIGMWNYIHYIKCDN